MITARSIKCEAQPFLRPQELARDDTPSLPVLQHALAWFERNGECFSAVCLLQPTSPFRKSMHIDACISLLETTGADTVITVRPVASNRDAHQAFHVKAHGELQVSTVAKEPIRWGTQLGPRFQPDGSVYIVKRDVLMEDHTLYGKRTMGLLMNPAESIDIDVPADWYRAAHMMNAIKRVPYRAGSRQNRYFLPSMVMWLESREYYERGILVTQTFS